VFAVPDCTLGFNGEGPLTEELKHRRDESIQSDRAEEKYEVEKICSYSEQDGCNFYQYVLLLLCDLDFVLSCLESNGRATHNLPGRFFSSNITLISYLYCDFQPEEHLKVLLH